MTLKYDEPEVRTRESVPPPVPTWRRVTERLLWIFGGIAVAIGLLIAFAGDDQWIGLYDDFSWRIGDIATAWIYVFLIGGAALLAAAFTLVWRRRSH